MRRKEQKGIVAVALETLAASLAKTRKFIFYQRLIRYCQFRLQNVTKPV